MREAIAACGAVLFVAAGFGCNQEPPVRCSPTGGQLALFPTPTGNVQAEYSTDGENAYVGGDIAFRIDDLAYLSAGLQGSRKWPGGVMAIAVPQDLTLRACVERAMQDWNALTPQTGFSVVARTNQADYVQITQNQDGCFSRL